MSQKSTPFPTPKTLPRDSSAKSSPHPLEILGSMNTRSILLSPTELFIGHPRVRRKSTDTKSAPATLKRSNARVITLVKPTPPRNKQKPIKSKPIAATPVTLRKSAKRIEKIRKSKRKGVHKQTRYNLRSQKKKAHT